MINLDSIKKASINWTEKKPFPHFIVDDFFEADVVEKLEKEFPDFGDNIWHGYENAIEIKKTCNNWNAFPPNT